MRSAALVLALVSALSACTPGPPLRSAPSVDENVRLAAADALVRAGCLECLNDAFREFEALHATARAARTAVLIALRQRELGMLDGGYLGRAEQLAAGDAALARSLAPLLEIASAMPARLGGAARVSDDAQLANANRARANRTDWIAELASRAQENELTAALWVAFNCAYDTSSRESVEGLLEGLPHWRGTALVAFEAATCGSIDRGALVGLLNSNPRFAEIHYYLGLHALRERQLDEADTRLEQAYAWSSTWPAVTAVLANVAMVAEDFARALRFYDETLALVLLQPDGMLGRARALTYLARHEEAISTLDDLLRLERWHVGEARYWRALNEAQRARYEEAWVDVERAAQLLVNTDVPKLAGIIQVRRQQFASARQKLEEARARSPFDCEVGHYLQIALAEQRTWNGAADVASETAACFDQEEIHLRRELEELRRSAMPADRRARQIVRRELQLVANERMRAACWFNAAVANFNLTRNDEARRFAQKAAGDQQFAERARGLLARLGG